MKDQLSEYSEGYVFDSSTSLDLSDEHHTLKCEHISHLQKPRKKNQTQKELRRRSQSPGVFDDDKPAKKQTGRKSANMTRKPTGHEARKALA